MEARSKGAGAGAAASRADPAGAQGPDLERRPLRELGLSARLVHRGKLDIQRVGLDRKPLSDLFHFLMTARWRWLLTAWVCAYVALNVVFASIYIALGASINNASPGSFLDAFFFSVQTMSTIGFGFLTPADTTANAVVALQSIVGLLGTATAAGLIFAKFSRPTARLCFSEVAAIGRRDGRPALMFRIGNQRGNNIVTAHMELLMTYLEETAESEVVRRFIKLELERPENELFSLLWQGTHFLDQDSPLAGGAKQTLSDVGAQLLVNVTGIDQDLGQSIHATFTYLPDDLVEDARLADMFDLRDPKRSVVDFHRFHETIPLPPSQDASAPRKSVD